MKSIDIPRCSHPFEITYNFRSSNITYFYGNARTFARLSPDISIETNLEIRSSMTWASISDAPSQGKASAPCLRWSRLLQADSFFCYRTNLYIDQSKALALELFARRLGEDVECLDCPIYVSELTWSSICLYCNIDSNHRSLGTICS